MEKKLQKPYLDYNLSIGQDLCKVNYQILLIILMKEFIKINVNMNMIIKNGKRVELNKRLWVHTDVKMI